MMIIETVRRQIEKSGLSRYQISQDTGVDQATLSRLMQGKTVTVETADILLKYFGLELKPKKKRGKMIAVKFGRITTKIVIGKKKKR
jgi:transcriptional regulator with XRE-family HTH domain